MHALRVTKDPRLASVGLVTAVAVGLCACGSSGRKTATPPPAAPVSMRLTSPAFAAGARIPARFTCDGGDESPPLAWSGVPAKARELALSVDDPDAPGGGFTHWTLYGIAPRTSAIAAGRTPSGAAAGRNSFGKTGYGGPCPPKGDKPHHYRFVLYALPSTLGLKPGASVDDFRTALSGAAPIAQGTFTGIYSR
jgi:Raf kinase inhibitor-like YbhB/YbcL family protein